MNLLAMLCAVTIMALGGSVANGQTAERTVKDSTVSISAAAWLARI